jgi:Lrp/AsnC family leucine-responsive transcriptional regulator
MTLDVHDAKILEILQKDARTSLKDLAEEAKLTPPTVSARMKSLEEMGIIGGYRVDIPPDAIGQRVMFFVLKAKPSDLEEAGEALAKISLVREVHLASGGRLIAVAVFRDASDQERLTNEIAGIPTIQEYDNYSVVKSKKRNSWAIVAEGAEVSLSCFYCKKPIQGTPYKIRLGGRDHYLCCPICEKAYREKYANLEAGARKTSSKS